MRRFSIVVVFSFLLCISVGAQNSVERAVDEFIKAQMERQKIPGVSLAVVKDGEPLIVKGYGFANVEHQVPVKPETIFQSGSVGKQFAAMAVMMLVDEGKIGLDERIGRYLDSVPESWSNITVRHLLSHTGGLTDYPGDFDYRKDYTEDELLKKAKAIPIAFKPGEKWQYSNLGYVVLGILIGKVTGKFYGDFLQGRIFKPLGMTSSRVISEADIIPNRADGYRLTKNGLKNQVWVSPAINTTADGSLYLTVLDMIKWDEALAGGKLLKRTSLDEMWTPIKLNNGKTHPYGFGWAIRNVNGHRVIEHGGAWQGFKAHIARYPDEGLTVILFANLIQTNQSKLAHGVAAIVDPRLKPKPVGDTEPVTTADHKELLQALTGGKADKNRFTAEAQKALFGERDRIIDFVSSMGPIVGFTLAQRSDENSQRISRYEVEYTGMTIFLVVSVNRDGKIAAMELQPE